MSSAKQCDRCGDFYKNNEKRPKERGDRVIPAQVSMSRIYTKTNRDETNEVFDLCDSCWNDFYKFMEGN